jgi:uncharacterized repeat protein (TIGR03803 family)
MCITARVKLGLRPRIHIASRYMAHALFFAMCLTSVRVHAEVGTITQVHSFTGGISGPDAGNPSAGIILGSDGNFYGTTVYGGSGSGTVYKLTPSGTETILLSFNGIDGATPTNLIQGSDGDLYGTTYFGGPTNGPGTVYKITTSGVQTILYAFDGGAAGSNPGAGLVEGSDGNFYGTTTGGGTGYGAVFQITPSGTLTVLHSFVGSDGSAPGHLTLGKGGFLYGVTFNGGADGSGTVFRMTQAGAFSVLYSFKGSPDAAQPNGPLLQASDGDLYGISASGGTGPCTPLVYSNCGTVFKVTPGGEESVLHSFSGSPNDGTASCLLCSWSYEGLIEGEDGNFYGDTLSGGSYTQGNCEAGCGTLFMITPGGKEVVLQSFIGPWSTPNDGWAPTGTLLRIRPGVFWGATFYGGSGWGNVYQYNIAASD